VSAYAHAVNALVSGLSALPGVAQPLAAARARTRFLNHDDIPFHALIEPAQDAVRDAAGRPQVVATRRGVGVVRVAEASVVLHRPSVHPTGAKTAGGNKQKRTEPDPPLPLRLVVTRVVDATGAVGREASRMRRALVRLSGRLMKHRVESTAPALLEGLGRLLAIDELMQTEDLDAILDLARRLLPRLFPDRSG
jgi:hypothetical protein